MAVRFRTEAEAARSGLLPRVRANAAVPPPALKGPGRKAGWREIGGQRIYARSAWEANVARYLEWLRSRREIHQWQHEPHEFWFGGIKRGVCSYKPDFRVERPDGSEYWIEVKGYLDGKSKTKLARMARYHPTVSVELWGETRYRALGRQMRGIITGWE